MNSTISTIMIVPFASLFISGAIYAAPNEATYPPSGVYTTDPTACGKKNNIGDLDNHFTSKYPILTGGKIYYLLSEKEGLHMQLVYADNDLSCDVESRAGKTLKLSCASAGGEYPDATKKLTFDTASRSIALDGQILKLCE